MLAPWRWKLSRCEQFFLLSFSLLQVPSQLLDHTCTDLYPMSSPPRPASPTRPLSPLWPFATEHRARSSLGELRPQGNISPRNSLHDRPIAMASAAVHRERRDAALARFHSLKWFLGESKEGRSFSLARGTWTSVKELKTEGDHYCAELSGLSTVRADEDELDQELYDIKALEEVTKEIMKLVEEVSETPNDRHELGETDRALVPS